MAKWVKVDRVMRFWWSRDIRKYPGDSVDSTHRCVFFMSEELFWIFFTAIIAPEAAWRDPWKEWIRWSNPRQSRERLGQSGGSSSHQKQNQPKEYSLSCMTSWLGWYETKLKVYCDKWFPAETRWPPTTLLRCDTHLRICVFLYFWFDTKEYHSTPWFKKIEQDWLFKHFEFVYLCLCVCIWYCLCHLEARVDSKGHELS